MSKTFIITYTGDNNVPMYYRTAADSFHEARRLTKAVRMNGMFKNDTVRVYPWHGCTTFEQQAIYHMPVIHQNGWVRTPDGVVHTDNMGQIDGLPMWP